LFACGTFVFYERSVSIHAFYVVLGRGSLNETQYKVFPLISVFQTFLLADPFWFRKITTDPHIPAKINRVSRL